jgi:diguanylate cyclase (GGDEF)-like protein
MATKHYGLKFAFTIALPLVLASCGVFYLTTDLISRVSTGANQEDHDRTKQVVNSAFRASQQQLANVATDNSYWDDAVHNTYGTPNQEWAATTWGEASQTGINYEMIFVVDRSQPETLVGFKRGKEFKANTNEFFAGNLDRLLDQLTEEPSKHNSKSAIMQTADGLAIVAAATIMPTSADIAIPQAIPRLLVMVKMLSPEYLSALEVQYVIDELKVGPGSASGDLILRNQAGEIAASVSWKDRKPGDIVKSTVLNKAFLILSFLGIVLALVAARCWALLGLTVKGEKKALHEALHDLLTGLPNRAALLMEIDRIAKIEKNSVAIAFVDLDGFKEVNDSYGHDVGDQLIIKVGMVFRNVVAEEHNVYRLGGDEFVFVISGINAEARACALAAQTINCLTSTFDLDGRIASVGASIGIAATAGAETNSEELMRRADIAMYQAKANGKNRSVVFNPDFDVTRNEEISITTELRQILQSGAIEVAFQPIVDAKSRDIVAVEALARWPASSPRKLSPDRFIAIAERQGLIDDLGNMILAKACAAAMHWSDLRVSINISTVQLQNPEFTRRTLNTIKASGIAYNRVELEITEGTLVSDIEVAQRIFKELRAHGIQIALDDFGTGFSSIGYLRQFNFDRIKIDRSLVNKVLTGSSEQQIVQGTMLMANGLAATVTAEGVELEDQIDILRLSGCNEMQGFYFYRPMPAADLSRLLAGTADEVRIA